MAAKNYKDVPPFGLRPLLGYFGLAVRLLVPRSTRLSLTMKRATKSSSRLEVISHYSHYAAQLLFAGPYMQRQIISG